MTERRTPRTAGETYYRRGSFNVWCQRCHRKCKAEELQVEWDGLRVCHKCFELRHPQDLVRGVVDLMGVPWAAPEGQDEFILNAEIQGLTTAPFNAGPDDLWDYTNTLSVEVSGGLLASVQPIDVLNGANLCAIQTPCGAWEVLQFVTATLTSPMHYTLSQLLRGRAGTETAMMSPLPAGAPVVSIGQSDASAYDWMELYLGVNAIPYSPTDFRAYRDVQGDVIITWSRRSRRPRLDQDNWDVRYELQASLPLTWDAVPLGWDNISLAWLGPAWLTTNYFQAPMDCPDEAYEIDVLSASGAVLRTLYAEGRPQTVYPAAAILADFGAPQSALSITGYQIDNRPGTGALGTGRGSARSVTLAIPSRN